MFWRRFVPLLRLCNTPTSIVSPLPFFAVSLFLISGRELHIFDLKILFIGIAISLLSTFGSNLWNHCNDLKEDIAQGKKTILTQDFSMLKISSFIAFTLYASSLLIIYYLSMELKRPIYIYFLIWALATWWYSDNLILKKITGFRLKEHYMGELITYSIAWPMYTLSIWLIYSDLNATGVAIAVIFLFFSLSGLLLKDLKDISGDREAGLNTFGVRFHPSQLIRYSCYLMVMYYFAMLNPLTIKFFGIGVLIMALPFIYFLKNTFIHMHRKNWALDMGDLKALKSIGYSVYISVIFMGLIAFF
ncbi:1,4-dihydroxy-2-naphthoate octaprenyltransferase [uncultured archaeon]|nr:1,4-dihydroxy-2-naphthoate octaprenyltransferase [uncultured archaeon]